MARLHGVKTLDMVNGEITKVAYDGAEYERVEGTPRSVGRAGDLLLNGYDRPDLELDAFYKIVNKSGYGTTIYDEVEDSHGSALIEGSVFRKVSVASVEAEPKPERLKVGDYAKVISGLHSQAKHDDIVKIIDDDKSVIPFQAMHLDGVFAGWFIECELVRATDEEVAEAKGATARAKFKKGAKVRLKSGGGETALYGFENGKVYEVGDPRITGGWDGRIGITTGPMHGFATPDQLELLSEEEFAEIEKWAAIGREVDEYKAGDIVAYDDPYGFETSGFGEVVSERNGGVLRIEAIDNYGDIERWNVDIDRLELVTPVESRFDRKDAE
ncbi:hypothetical protein P4U97_21555 [Bacillus swezeyi]|uniref:hypothetical protein n=1 Tax=Bacillus swezeyi TaxID=1925020 RepID=UPI002E1DC9BD|nr:hypothetical protein [Bacillus swezeyi]